MLHACIAGIEPNAHAYAALMTLCRKGGQWQQAMQIFREMQTVGIEIDKMAYNSAIAACAAGGDWEQAWGVMSSKPAVATTCLMYMPNCLAFRLQVTL